MVTHLKNRENSAEKADTHDLDEQLEDSELNDVKGVFWQRYKVRYPPETYPAASLISRVSRETSKRMLMVACLWTAKNLTHQLTTKSKRQRVGTNLYTE